MPYYRYNDNTILSLLIEVIADFGRNALRDEAGGKTVAAIVTRLGTRLFLGFKVAFLLREYRESNQ